MLTKLQLKYFNKYRAVKSLEEIAWILEVDIEDLKAELPFYWSRSSRQQLKELYLSGLPNEEICKIMGVKDVEPELLALQKRGEITEPRPREFTNEQLLSEVLRCKTKKIYEKYRLVRSLPSIREVERRFGTWTNARNSVLTK